MIHKQAAINTAGVLVLAMLFSGAIYSALYILPIEITLGIIGVVVFCILVNTLYSMEKHRLETLDRLRKL